MFRIKIINVKRL